MGNTGRHKVCYEVLGVPVIVRSLETYNLCGSILNVIVVGVMADSVMAAVKQHFPQVAYAFQEQPRGTGDATRKGARILKEAHFDGDVLVVAGDKVIHPDVIRKLQATHGETGADVTLATAKRPPGSSAGILLTSRNGNIVGILEEAERRRIAAIAALSEAFHKKNELEHETIENIIIPIAGDKTAGTLTTEICAPNNNDVLTHDSFESLFSKDERAGHVRVGDEMIPATQILDRFGQMNMSTYLFRAPVLFDALSRLNSNRVNQEEYLTDIFEILAQGRNPAKIAGVEIPNPEDLMAFNDPRELSAIEQVFRRRLHATKSRTSA